jgi:hypothetical protein
MQSISVEELVKKIFSDEKTRMQFVSDPGGVMSNFSLTEQEKRAILTTHAKLGLVTSNSQQLEATINTNVNWLSPIPL